MGIYLKDYLAPVISFLALIVAGLSLKYTLKNARKNIRLSIQQAVIKIAIEKAKDCNSVWEKSSREYHDFKKLLGNNLAAFGKESDEEMKKHYDVISEMVISEEIIMKSFAVYSKQDVGVTEEKEDYAFIFWKQLNTGLRGFFTSKAVVFALDYKIKTTYGTQILQVHDFVKKHNENQSTLQLFEKLRLLPEKITG